MPKDQLLGERYCLNCGSLLAEESLFCHVCSQKCTDGKISVSELFKEFFDSAFNIDSRFFKTLLGVFVPGKLTVQYFLGRHKTYAHPIRLFLVSGVLFFTLLSIFIDPIIGEKSGKSDELRFAAYRSQVIDSIQAIKNRALVEYPAESSQLKVVLDTIDQRVLRLKAKDSSEFFLPELEWPFNITTTSILMNRVDAIEMSEEELAKTYGYDADFFAQLTIAQQIKFRKDERAFVSAAIQQSIWSFLFMMLALALILKILYVRRKVYYVEHLIFSFHFHSFVFVVGSLYLLAAFILPFLKDAAAVFSISGIFFSVSLIYMYISMKRIYGQGWFKTFVKFSILNFSYFIVFWIFIAFSVLVTFLIF